MNEHRVEQEDVLIEIKIGKKTPTDFIAQSQAALWITGHKAISPEKMSPQLKKISHFRRNL
jgi:hypothetical protein